MSSKQGTHYFGSTTRLAGAHAEYRRSDYYFERCQSPQFRELPWDFRSDPVRPWSRFAGVAIAGAAVAAIACTLV